MNLCCKTEYRSNFFTRANVILEEPVNKFLGISFRLVLYLESFSAKHARVALELRFQQTDLELGSPCCVGVRRLWSRLQAELVRMLPSKAGSTNNIS